jgi:hypothetical protein
MVGDGIIECDGLVVVGNGGGFGVVVKVRSGLIVSEGF